MSSIRMSEARQSLPDIINRVAYGGERVVINRSGKKVAAVVSISDLELLQAMEDKADQRALKAARAEVKKKGAVSWTKLKEELGL